MAREGLSSSDSTIWEAERILGKRTYCGKLQYRIKWKDYTTKESTWEPAENILDPSLLNEFIKSKRAPKRGRVRKAPVNKASSSRATNVAEVERASTSSKNSSAHAGKKRGATIHSIAAALANGSTPAKLMKQAASSGSSRAPNKKPFGHSGSGVHAPEGILYATPVEYLNGTTVELPDPKSIPKGQVDIILTMNGKRLKFTQGFDTDFFKN